MLTKKKERFCTILGCLILLSQVALSAPVWGEWAKVQFQATQLFSPLGWGGFMTFFAQPPYRKLAYEIQIHDQNSGETWLPPETGFFSKHLYPFFFYLPLQKPQWQTGFLTQACPRLFNLLHLSEDHVLRIQRRETPLSWGPRKGFQMALPQDHLLIQCDGGL